MLTTGIANTGKSIPIAPAEMDSWTMRDAARRPTIITARAPKRSDHGARLKKSHHTTMANPPRGPAITPIGMARNAAGLRKAREKVAEVREEFWRNVTVTGSCGELNQALERAGRVADFMEFADLMIHDALMRDESCGAHFREEHQTEDGEPLRDDENFCHVAAYEFNGVGASPTLHKEPLVYENVSLSQRSYK